MGQDSVVGVVTYYRLYGPGIDPGGGEVFCTRPDWAWDPPSLLYNGYQVSFPGVKQPGYGIDYPPPSSAEVKERVELYFYSSGPTWPVVGWTLALLYLNFYLINTFLAFLFFPLVRVLIYCGFTGLNSRMDVRCLGSWIVFFTKPLNEMYIVWHVAMLVLCVFLLIFTGHMSHYYDGTYAWSSVSFFWYDGSTWS
jgi:hypothetical protein